MQTQKPILNLAPSNLNNPALARQNNVAAPEISFNQVLSREIAERPKTATREASAPVPANNALSNNAPTNNAPTKAPSAEGKPANATSANPNTDNTSKSKPNQASASPPPKTDPGKKAADAGSKPTEANSAGAAEDEALAAQQTDPTAAMLALVASFNSPTAIAQTPVQTEAAGVLTARVSLDNSPISLTPSVDNPDAKAASKAEDFAQLLPASIAGKGIPNPAGNGENATPLTTEADAKAIGNIANKPGIVADLKTVDPKAAAKPDLAQAPTEALAAKLSANPAAGRSLPAENLASASAETTPAETGDNITVNTLSQGIAVNKEINDSNVSKLQQQIGPRVGNPGWDQALGQKVVYMAGAGQQSATLTLNPPELGPLQVVLHFANDQANASFTAAQPEVRQALEAALPKLREMMSDAGITLGNATVGTNLPNQQQSAQGEQASGQSRQNNFSRFGGNDTAADNAAPVKITRPIHSGQGMVDTFV